IFEEQPNIFTNKDVYEIAFDEVDVFYTSCKRLTLVFEPIKQVINFLESRTANLANCFIGFGRSVRPDIWNDICAPAIALFNFFVEDEHIHLQELAKTMFAIAPLKPI
ncbi:4208_t:CDS:2, partial [Gigaspora rosea]